MKAGDKMGLVEKNIQLTTKLVNCIEFKEFSRVNPNDFTRTRKMNFEELIFCMLMSFKGTTQSAIRRFFKDLSKGISMKQQSFSEARYKIKAEAFIRLFMLTVTAMLPECRNTWHSYRVFAVDGSKITLPADSALLAHFGGLGPGAKSPSAQGSICYDVLNDIVVDADIAPLECNERTLAMAHIDNCCSLLPDEKKLMIFDRGYPSFELIYALETTGMHYVMRVRKKFNVNIDAQTKSDGFVWLEQGNKRIPVRVIKFILDSGEEEVLITNITDKRLGKNAFKKLYFLRWSSETKYDLVKNKLEIENFTARTVEGIRQDFFATMYLTNIAAAAKHDAKAEIEEARKDKDNKHEYQANTNELIGILKDRLVLAFTEDDPDKQAALISEIVKEIEQSVVPKRMNRSKPRNKNPRKSKFHHNKKSNC